MSDGEKSWITLNIGGREFRTTRETLRSIPDSKLGKLVDPDNESSHDSDIYHFDHDARLFDSVLECFRRGEVHLDTDLCMEFVIAEFKFWRVDLEKYLSPCCVTRLHEYYETQQLTTRVQIEEEKEFAEDALIIERIENGTKFERIRFQLWLSLERPESSNAARRWAIFILLLTFGAMTNLALLTYVVSLVSTHAPGMINTTEPIDYMELDHFVHKMTGLSYQIMLALDLTLNAVFISDILIRFVVCPDKLKFLLKVHTVVDLGYVIGFIVYETLVLVTVYKGGVSLSVRDIASNLILIVQVLRLGRVTKLKSSYVQLKALLLSLRHSLVEITLTFLLLMAVLFVIAVVAYQLEKTAPDTQIANIPKAFWWALITLTTVGYGDTIPKTIGGYLLGGLVPLLGLLLTGLAISVLANNVSICSQIAAQQHRTRQILHTGQRGVTHVTPSNVTSTTPSKVEESSLL